MACLSEFKQKTCHGATRQPTGLIAQTGCAQLKEVEILALLPLGGSVVGRRDAALLDPALVAAGLVALELQVVVDEHLAELLLEQRLVFERVERRRQALGQQRPIGGIGLVVARPRIGLAVDAVETGGDLRRDEQVRISRRLAAAVLDPARGIAGRAQHAQHRAAVVVAPAGAIGRQRIRDGSGGSR